MFWINYAKKAFNQIRFGREFRWFETEIGLKYYNSPFHSDQFVDYPVESRINSESGYEYKKFICPPDMLKNDFTWAGVEIISSPHYKLMQSLRDDALTYDNPYLINAYGGTLDARPPQKLKIKNLKEIFLARKTTLLGDDPIIINALKLTSSPSEKIMILDGKHRLALALALNLESRIVVHFLPNTFASHEFFLTMYSAVLSKPHELYSRNQALILDIRGASLLTKKH